MRVQKKAATFSLRVYLPGFGSIFFGNIISRAGEPGVFGSLEPEPLEKKKQEPEPLAKKVRSRSRYKISRLLSPAIR